MNKKAQLDFPLLPFIVIVVILLMTAPIVLKLLHNIRGPLASAAAGASGNNTQVNASVNYAFDVGDNYMDGVVALLLIFGIIVMLISSFFIDTHPFFVVLYIIFAFVLALGGLEAVNSLNNIYGSAFFEDETADLPFSYWVLQNFSYIYVGVMIVTGIIIFGKVAIFPSRGRV